MTTENAIATLSAQFDAAYEGFFVAAVSGDLIQDIMFEKDMGKVYHRFGKTIVEDSNLIPLANYYA